MLNRNEFDELTQTRGAGCVSIFLPTHRRGRETRQDPIRLGNLVRESERRAAAAGLDERQIDAALAPVRELLDDEHFWRHQADGLALFARDGALVRHRLQHSVEELAFVGERFCVRPLLPSRDLGQRFFVLALSQNRVRLLECTRESARELDVHDIPESLADALGYDVEQQALQFHTGATRRGGRFDTVFHGQGSGDDDAKDEVEKYARAVDAGVTALLQNRAPEAPLVLAAVGYVDSIYRGISEHPRIVEGAVEGNPDEADTAARHEHALPLVERALARDADRELERFEAIRHTNRATSGVANVLPAAQDAQVETMFVACDAARWGRYDEETREVEVHGERRDGDDELLDRAVAAGLASGAGVIGLRGSEWAPAGEPIAATLRFVG